MGTPADDTAIHEVELPAELASAIERTAGQLSVPVETILLAAHAKVAGVLTGERAVHTGVGELGAVVRLSVLAGTWAELVRIVAEGSGKPVVGRAVTTFAVRAEPALPVAALPKSALFGTDVLLRPDRVTIRIAHAAAGPARRIAGYLATALRLTTQDPHRQHEADTLVPEAEARWQIEELSGPVRQLPDQRAHEIIAERAGQFPDRVAARAAAGTLTYGELNRRANRLAGFLLAQGVEAEEPVAVVLERTLEWLVATLAVFKAGAVYLPVEPHFPAQRVGAMLERSGARTLIAVRDTTACLPDLPDRRVVLLDGVDLDAYPDTDPQVVVGPERLAYIYFTSGSTGEPKGAMLEHGGMVNHLLAKIEDLGVESGTVVAQTAPQCFDISLWQLIAPLLVGGETLIVGQDAVVDVDLYLDTLVEGGVEVVQMVPSYLDVILGQLQERPRSLGKLRCVSVTGEAVSKDLVERWFTAFPGMALVNAYGLTETSDDTNHEVLREPPAGPRVPLGRAVRNVVVSVVDEQLRPVPFGAPGEIVFSGVCVGRGYINDPERTAAAFLDDPARPGSRLYRSGDFGRWLDDGRLEFLGRRDAQIKIRGFRVEIDEIEHRLLEAPDVRQAAVVAVDGGDGARLVAFYTTDVSTAVSAEGLAELLGASLPAYMVPGEFRRVDALPLTGNGKVDRKDLRARAADRVGPPAYESPRTAMERRIAAAWAEVLNVPVETVGRRDDFVASGGTSLTGIRLIVKLDRLFKLEDLVQHPVLADLAAKVDAESAPTL
ncbi:non-ribosomal peptide synthetase [Micromonospora sp. DT201]|uniref:non-ribosomal peptide synthetase n=1 Tax=Micromonospora sp. DT201 TaxID=3393442 RepID=UPI003CE6938F